MFKDKLIETRKSNGYTQENLSALISVSRSLVAIWEQGRAYPTINDLENICKIFNIEFDELMSKEELKRIYGIVLKKNKDRRKVIMFLSSIVSLLLIVTFLLPFCFVSDVLQEYKLSRKYGMKYGYNTLVLDDESIIEVDQQTPLYINGEQIKYQPDKINYSLFYECSVTYDIYKQYNGYKLEVGEYSKINKLELLEPISDSVVGFYIDFEAKGEKEEINYNKDSVLYYYFDDQTNETVSNFTGNEKKIRKMDNDIGISYYELEIILDLNFDEIKEYYLRNNIDDGYARIPIYYLLSNGEKSSLPTHHYFGTRCARFIELSWGSGNSYGVSDDDGFYQYVCNIKSEYIEPKSKYLYQNVLFCFDINMNW